jgi:hypothetical protein
MDLRLNAVEHDALVKEISRLEPLLEHGSSVPSHWPRSRPVSPFSGKP